MEEQISQKEFGMMKSQINEIHKTLLGNGQPGVVQNLNALVSRIDKIEGGIGVIKWVISIFGASAVTALGISIRLYIQ